MTTLKNQSKLVDYSGAKVVVFPGVMNKDHLEREIEALGFKVQVKGRSNFAALTEACKHAAKSLGIEQQIAATSLKDRNKNGLETVRIVKGERANDYDQLFTANVSKDEEITIGPNPLGHTLTDNIREGYVRFKRELPVGSVRAVMDELLERKCDAMKIMTSLFWVPEQRLERWLQIEAVFLKYNHKCCYTIPSDPSDPATVEMVTDAIRVFVEKEAAEVMKDLATNSVDSVEVQKRRLRVADLQRKLDDYEECIGHTLGSLQEAAEKADMALAKEFAVESDDEAFAEVF